MSEKIKKIIAWVLSGLISANLLLNAVSKVIGSKMVEKMLGWGFSEEEVLLVAVGEIISVVLFLIPKTSSLGTLLLTAYLGGMIATHMQAMPPYDDYISGSVVLILIWIAALLRVPGVMASFAGQKQKGL